MSRSVRELPMVSATSSSENWESVVPRVTMMSEMGGAFLGGKDVAPGEAAVGMEREKRSVMTCLRSEVFVGIDGAVHGVVSGRIFGRLGWEVRSWSEMQFARTGAGC